jgi:high-affinity iron transporter
MLSTAIVIFREILEVAIILSVVMAATKGLEGRNRWVLLGILGGLIGSGFVAAFAEVISNAAEGIGQELFNAAILLTASVVIGGTALWMSKHAREMTNHLRHVSNQVIEGAMPLYSIAVVIALAILREGAEIILFVHGMMASGQDMGSIVSGGTVGFIGGCALGAALYFGLVSISPKHVFSVTTWLLIFLCAGMAATAAKFLASAGWFGGFDNQLWDSAFILSDDGIPGKTLHALFGYTSRPTTIQIIFYLATLAILLASKKLISRKRV